MSLQDTVRTVVSRLASFAIQKLIPLAEHALPPPVELVVEGLLALPFVKDAEARAEAFAGDEAAKAEGYLAGKLEDFVHAEALKHPAIAQWVAAVRASGAAGQVASEVEKTFGPKLVQGLKDLAARNGLGDLETFFHQMGVPGF